MAGLYVHIPFCASRCIYCGFYSTTERNLQSSYVDALVREISLRKEFLQGEPLTTVYFGGGTPSTLSLPLLACLCSAISEAFDVSGVVEWTMECNPDDVSEEFCDALSVLPINRVSMGVQTFDAARLRWLHRRHTPDQVAEACRRLRMAGIGNISLDLMFGFPGQSVEDVRADVRSICDLQPEHISAYSLMYEEGTPLWKALQKGDFEEVDEDVSLEMYNTIIDLLVRNGYEHYEISNFSKPGLRSVHNSSYWNGVSYLGIGAAAHSYDRASREWNVSDLRCYIDSISKGEVPSERELLDEDTVYNDLVTTALRTKEGIHLSSLQPKYHRHVLSEARRHMENGNLIIDEGRLHLTRKGLFISDSVMADLIY